MYRADREVQTNTKAVHAQKYIPSDLDSSVQCLWAAAPSLPSKNSRESCCYCFNCCGGLTLVVGIARPWGPGRFGCRKPSATAPYVMDQFQVRVSLSLDMPCSAVGASISQEMVWLARVIFVPYVQHPSKQPRSSDAPLRDRPRGAHPSRTCIRTRSIPQMPLSRCPSQESCLWIGWISWMGRCIAMPHYRTKSAWCPDIWFNFLQSPNSRSCPWIVRWCAGGCCECFWIKARQVSSGRGSSPYTTGWSVSHCNS